MDRRFNEIPEVKKIIKVVKYVYLSAFLDDEKPLSLMLIAPPEQSKTWFISNQYTSKYVRKSTDLSFSGVIKTLKNAKIKQILIPDFLKLTEKKTSTKDNLISLFNGFLEEGVYNIDLGNKEELNFKGKRGGIITSITDQSWFQNKKKWEKIGFSSRILKIQYSYSEEMMNSILNEINKEETTKKEPKMLNYKKQKIKSSPELNRLLNGHCNFSTRLLINLQILLKCSALEKGKTKVDDEDVGEILDLIPILTKKVNIK